MASTRNKNTSGNYEQEQNEKHNLRKYEMYIGSRHNDNPYYAGLGLLSGKYSFNTLTTNSADVESELIGRTYTK